MIKIITRSIEIESKYLDWKLRDHILDKLRDVLIGDCSKDDGYILSVTRLVRIDDNYISLANSVATFVVTFEAETLKPIKGSIVDGKVSLIISQGIFVEVQEYLKILIPSDKMEEQKYDPDLLSFGNIKQGMEIRIVIEEIKYEKKKFICIGKLN